MAKKRNESLRLVFRSNSSIGSPAAEDDDEFLKQCFVQTSALDDMLDIHSPRSIVLGRTGSGKSANMIAVAREADNVIIVEPNDLALSYIANCEIVRFLDSLNIDLDIFFQLLWRHFLCVEILNYHFKIRTQSDYEKFKNWVGSISGKAASRKAAFEYLNRWNGSFWLEREERLKEITNTLHSDVKTSLGIDAQFISASLSEINSLTEQDKEQVVTKAQKVVNEVQIRQLGEVINILSEELFSDPQRKYYLLIDKLDESWVDDSLRYRLIRALIETIKHFRRIKTLKILVALRTDLLDRVYRLTRDAGFQREKYEGMNLPLTWRDDQLIKIIDRRINYLMKSRYTKQNISFFDLFPTRVGEKTTDQYIIQRTLLRPRDAIAFVNSILNKAQGRPEINVRTIREAEPFYSQGRRSALIDEWLADFPNLDLLFGVFEKMPSRFRVQDIFDTSCSTFADKIISEMGSDKDPFFSLCGKYVLEEISVNVLKREICCYAYKVGIIGIKLNGYDRLQYCYVGPPEIDANSVSDLDKVEIHPMFWATLGVHRSRRGLLEDDSS